jgi:plasmid maintenance system antidote protein VapI
MASSANGLVSRNELASILGISDNRVSELAKAGIAVTVRPAIGREMLKRNGKRLNRRNLRATARKSGKFAGLRIGS